MIDWERGNSLEKGREDGMAQPCGVLQQFGVVTG